METEVSDCRTFGYAVQRMFDVADATLLTAGNTTTAAPRPGDGVRLGDGVFGITDCVGERLLNVNDL